MTDEPDRFVRIERVLELTGLSRSTLYRKIKGGTFPHQVQLSARCSGWRLSDVRSWTADPGSFTAKGS